ncbi:MAG: type II toxin-antitoxin system PemK/MazF family toxin [Patescibacteria group bacterium]
MQKDFDTWNQKKKQIQLCEFTDYVHEREVWWCSLGVNIGFEQDGKHEHFERPILIIKKFNKDVVLVVPLSSQMKDNKYHVNIVHNDENFSAIISQLRLISTKRLLRKMYHMDSSIFDTVRKSIKDIL